LSRIYRVLREPFAQAPFDGEGAYRYGGRWSSPGVRVSYASEYQSLAMLEYFVHLDADDPPADLVIATADVPDDLARESIEESKLPSNWRETPAPDPLKNFGDEFVQRGECALLLAPSALAPGEHNVLLNPAHPDFARITVRRLEPLFYDKRMFRRSHHRRKQK
jgi:RES domain-containing protein